MTDDITGMGPTDMATEAEETSDELSFEVTLKGIYHSDTRDPVEGLKAAQVFADQAATELNNHLWFANWRGMASTA